MPVIARAIRANTPSGATFITIPTNSTTTASSPWKKASSGAPFSFGIRSSAIPNMSARKTTWSMFRLLDVEETTLSGTMSWRMLRGPRSSIIASAAPWRLAAASSYCVASSRCSDSGT